MLILSILNTLTRLVVMPEAQTPPTPTTKSREDRVTFAVSLSGASPCLTHLQLLATPRPPRSAELFEMRDASPWGGIPFRPQHCRRNPKTPSGNFAYA